MSAPVAPPPTSTNPLTPQSDAPARPPSRFRTLRWRRSAGEFLLIVVGVLVALSADAVRQTFAERQRASTYLADLKTDMETMLNIVDRGIAFDSLALRRTSAMVDYLQSTARLSEDSVKSLRGLAWSGFVPVAGTIRALSETGDLRLMSRGVRRSLTAYATDQQYAERQIELSAIDVSQAAHQIREREEIYRRYRGSSADTTSWDYVLDVERMRADPQLRAAYITGLVRLRFHADRLKGFRVSVTGLQKALANK